jgi:hypothetical protein
VEMQRCYGATENASLRELSERLRERVRLAERGDAADTVAPAALLGDDAHLMTRMRLILTHSEATFERRAQLGIQIALELTGAQDGFVVVRAAKGGVVGTGDRILAPELVSWAEQQLGRMDLDQTAILRPDQTLAEAALMTLGDLRYTVIPFGSPGESNEAAMALVLGFRGQTPRAPSVEVLAILARHLVETQLHA